MVQSGANKQFRKTKKLKKLLSEVNEETVPFRHDETERSSTIDLPETSVENHFLISSINKTNLVSLTELRTEKMVLRE